MFFFKYIVMNRSEISLEEPTILGDAGLSAGGRDLTHESNHLKT
jgi:hypothetical protein